MEPTSTASAPAWQQIVDLWFGALDADGYADGQHSAKWWKKDPAFDAMLRDRFESTHGEIVAGTCDAWLAEPAGRLAQVIVLDQFSRNMYRDTPGMYATDALALRIAAAGIAAGADRTLATAQRTFLYMPFMHSETLADQDRCVALFAAMRDELGGPAGERLTGNVKFAIAHRDIVARFGRFPHRNAILGRTSTAEELAFLDQPGSAF